MIRIHRTRVSSTSQRSVTALVLTLLVSTTFCGCDGSRAPSPGRVDFSRRPARRESAAPEQQRVRIVTRRPRSGDVIQLAPATARESRTRIEPSRRSARGESLSLGSPRIEPSTSRSRSSEEKLGVLERYLKRSRASTRSEPSGRLEPSGRSARTESGSFSVETGNEIDWRPIFLGIDHVAVRASRPWPMFGQALRIDLEEDGIEFVTTPKGDRGSDTVGMKTSTFLRRLGCKAAINAAFFRPMQSREGQPVDVCGLQISRGELVSPAQWNQPALLITRDNRARIADPPFDIEGVYNAVSGNGRVLENGRVVGSRNDTHPRVGAGVSRDGRYLFMLVIDGRQEHWGWSRGATRWHVGDWLKRLGAWDGINLDGGGTATMVVADARGQPKLVNRPIHNNVPRNERVSGSHLGVIARPLPE